MSPVTVSIPATIANLGPGFDVFGLALSEPPDLVQGEMGKNGMKIFGIEGKGASGIPSDPELNAVTIAAREVARMLNKKEGINFRIKKGIKPGSGLGSSAAGAVAGALIANELFGGNLSQSQLIQAAAVAEEKIAGEIHFDNIVPAVVGGFTIVASTKPLEFIRLDPPQMKVVVAVPDLELMTKRAREVLPRQIPLGDATSNLGHASAMVAALAQKDLKTFGRHIVDSIAEPSRLPLIPGFLQVRNAALKAGALGFSISGSGPSVFAITEREAEAKRVSAEMEGAFKQVGINCEMIITSPGEGAKVVK